MKGTREEGADQHCYNFTGQNFVKFKTVVPFTNFEYFNNKHFMYVPYLMLNY